MALPAIGEALQSTPAELIWVVHAYQLAVVAVLLPAVCFASLVFTLSVVALQKGLAVVLAALGLMLGSDGWLLLRQRGQAAPMLSVDLMRRSPAIFGGVGLGILSLGMASLGLFGVAVSFGVMALCMALCGVGFGLFQSPNLRAIMASAPAHRTSGASGMVALARLIGQASGAALVALCFNLFGPQGAGHAVMLGALTAGIGAVLSMARLRAR